MLFAKKLVLHCPNGLPVGIAELATQFVADGVKLVAVVGPACREIEDIIDDAAIQAGSPGKNFILTSAHPDESLADVVAFAEWFVGDYDGPVQVVELRE